MIEYPVKFKSCPSCGSESRIVETEAEEEISKGNLKVGTKIPILVSRTALFNPADTSIIARKTIPMLIGYYDVCSECGTLYCIEIQKGTAIAEPQIKHHGDDGSMPFMGKG